ncbi:MAG: hypothetical protein Q9222_005563, partial [Ikaeria aurantiellina]
MPTNIFTLTNAFAFIKGTIITISLMQLYESLFFTLAARHSPPIKLASTTEILNTAVLAIANTGYRIQSHILRIPDRMGFFAPGPPRLQVYEVR